MRQFSTIDLMTNDKKSNQLPDHMTKKNVINWFRNELLFLAWATTICVNLQIFLNGWMFDMMFLLSRIKNVWITEDVSCITTATKQHIKQDTSLSKYRLQNVMCLYNMSTAKSLWM